MNYFAFFDPTIWGATCLCGLNLLACPFCFWKIIYRRILNTAKKNLLYFRQLRHSAEEFPVIPLSSTILYCHGSYSQSYSESSAYKVFASLGKMLLLA